VQLACLSLFHVNGRYRLVLLPFLIPFAAHGLRTLWKTAFRKSGFRERVRIVLPAVLALAVGSLPLYRLDPADDSYRRGVFALEAGDPRKARAEFEDSVRLSPDYFLAWGSLGYLDLHEGALDRAVDRLKRARTLKPRDIFVLNNLAAALAESGRYVEAEPLLRQVLSLDPDNELARRNLRLLSGVTSVKKIP
jgi:tetratricopeptide (TPR) repeat protein